MGFNYLIFNSFFSLSVVFSSCIFSSFSVFAGGVSLGTTRIIYPSDSQHVSVTVNNSDEKSRFLIKSWIDDKDNKRSTDFTISPPLFMIGSEKTSKIRIALNIKGKIHSDREIVYWFNTQAIPQMNAEKKDENVLQLASTSRIKLFVRPKGLSMDPADAPDYLIFSHDGGELVVHNPTPYHITLVNFRDGSSVLPNTMVPPKDNVRVKSHARGKITFSTINDYGAITKLQNGKMK